MLRAWKHLAAVAAAAALMSPSALGYYHFVFYSSRTGPFAAAPVKFDLGFLPNNTVSYFISNQGPQPTADSDTKEAIYSQIRLAAKVWNEVETSQLRIRFGGFADPDAPQSTPGIDVVFSDEIPEGIIAQTLPMIPTDVSWVANGASIVPILRSRIWIRKNLSNRPSYNEDFFLTLVHEFGHALGLQHSLTSSVMSTSVTRAAHKASPLAADDIAGISLLYPVKDFAQRTGAISGRVSVNGQGVNMASVVAIAPGGAVVSAITHPDGSYKIEGLPPGNYLIYAHPLPPALQGESRPANIEPPADPQQSPFPANLSFDTQFYPGTKDWSQATTFEVSPGGTRDNVDFSLQPRGGPSMHSVTLYGYHGPVAVQSAPLPVRGDTAGRHPIVFAGTGLMNGNGQLTPGLNASIIGNTAQILPGTLAAYQNPYLLMYVDVSNSTPGSVAHLALRAGNDLYILPAAFQAVDQSAPAIHGLEGRTEENGTRMVAIAGANLSAQTRVLFDGAAGTVRSAGDGILQVEPPPAASSYRARIAALNSDGQSSTIALGSNVPPEFTYDGPESPAIGISPGTLPAGVDALVEIFGYNTNFADGHTVVGFGSSDIAVRRSWVVSPTRVLVNVSIAAGAAPGAVSITVVTGLQAVTASRALTIEPSHSNQVSLRAPVTNQATGLAGIPAGGNAVIRVTPLPELLTGWTMTISERRVPIFAGPTGIIAAVPANLSPGPAVIRLSTGGDTVQPIVMQVDAPPPVILDAAIEGVRVDSVNAAKAGDKIVLTVSGLNDGVAATRRNVFLVAGGIEHGAISIAPAAVAGQSVVEFVLDARVPYGSQALTLGVDTRVSAAYTLNVKQQ